ncbi:MAG: hypothetical protein K9L02_04705, partial [Acholeplasmataceae bacterium]|nr:hypothetical protein [Acholeplasmataceae bacterium]
MFGDNSSGFLNESNIVDYINRVSNYSEFNSNIKGFLEFLYQDVSATQTFEARQLSGQGKPDLVITSNGIEKYVSVKKGSGNSVHQEQLSLFENFMRRNGVPDSIISILKQFHYADGTINGSGTLRIDSRTFIQSHTTEIIQLNVELNREQLL